MTDHVSQMMDHMDGAIGLLGRKRTPIMEIDTEFCESPCVVKIYHAKRGCTPPGYNSTFNDPRVDDPEVEFELHDADGNRLDWLEAKVSDDDIFELMDSERERDDD